MEQLYSHLKLGFEIVTGTQYCNLKVPPDHPLLNSVPNLGQLISRWEINKFENCWYKSVRILEVRKLLFQKFLNLSSSQRDMSGPILGVLSNDRWSGANLDELLPSMRKTAAFLRRENQDPPIDTFHCNILSLVGNFPSLLSIVQGINKQYVNILCNIITRRQQSYKSGESCKNIRVIFH